MLLGCMYRHPSMEVKDFNENYLSPLMDKLGDKKDVFLPGDSNIDLVKNDIDTHIYFFGYNKFKFICSSHSSSCMHHHTFKNID